MPVACTFRTGAIHRGARGARRGVFGRVLQQEVCTRAVRRGACGPGRIRLCATPDDLRPWTARAPTIRDRVASKYSRRRHSFSDMSKYPRNYIAKGKFPRQYMPKVKCPRLDIPKQNISNIT